MLLINLNGEAQEQLDGIAYNRRRRIKKPSAA